MVGKERYISKTSEFEYCKFWNWNMTEWKLKSPVLRASLVSRVFAHARGIGSHA
jgi:hypothetical protein